MSAHSRRNLETEYNAYFESYIAITLSERRDLFPTVDRVSNSIVDIIVSQREKILANLKNKTQFKNLLAMLYGKDSGALFHKKNKKNKKNTPDAVIHDIQSILLDKNASLIHVMSIHNVFGSHILRFLEKENENAMKSRFQIVQSVVGLTKKHVEKKPEEKILCTTQLGITRSPLFCEKLNLILGDTRLKNYICPHKRSIERFDIEYNATPFRELVRNHIPLAAGLSTHTVELLMAAKLYEMKSARPFTPAEWQEYSLAYFVYLTLAGYHTFHEVMLVTATYLNVSYQLDSYLSHFPQHLKQHPFIKALAKKFPAQLKSK